MSVCFLPTVVLEESAFWSSVEGRGLHLEGEGNISRVEKKYK